MFYVSVSLLQGSGEDVLRSVLVAVVVRPADGTRPVADGQILRDGILMAAAGARLARRVEGVHLQDGRTAPCSLVSEHSKERRPARVRNGTRKMVVPQHIPDLQVLDGDHLVFADQPCCELLQEVLADVSDMLVNAGNADTLLVAVARTWHLPCKAALLPREFPLILSEDAGIGNRFAIAVSEEFFKPDINAELARTTWRESDIFLDAKRNKVFAGCCARDGGIQDASLKVAALADADVAELRQSQTVFVIEADAALLIPRAVALLMPPFRLEARVSRDFLEELLKSCVKIPQSSLQCHGICFFQPRSILATFQIRQELASFSKTDRTVVGIPFVAPQGEEMIVHETAASERSVDAGCLCRIRVDSKFVAASGRHDAHAPFLGLLSAYQKG